MATLLRILHKDGSKDIIDLLRWPDRKRYEHGRVVTSNSIAYLAGLFDGEGSVMYKQYIENILK